MENILITGGAGFVGSSLAIGLSKHCPGVSITALDNLRRRGSELNIKRLQQNGINFIHGDIRNQEDIESIKADLIIECSADPSVLAGYGDSPKYVVNTNLGGTINCLELARNNKAAMIFLSTSRVYPMAAIQSLNFNEGETRLELAQDQPIPGVSPEGISEDFPLEGARSMYGATKLCSEYIMQEYLSMYDIKGVINRCGVIAGPWQMGKVDQGVAALWVARHIFNGKLDYIGYGGQGKQVRDMLHIDDLLSLIVHQIDNLSNLNGQTFNIGGGKEVSASLSELTALCQEITGNKIQIGSTPQTRPADIPWYITDNTKITKATNWKPTKTTKTIIKDIHDWITKNTDDLRDILT